jgi:RNA polymerase sigma-70 factor, ECF subfamily
MGKQMADVADEARLAATLAIDLDGSFEQVVRVYQDRLFAFAWRLTGSAPDAEEGTQDAFVRAYRALQRYPAEQVRTLRLRPWLYQITLNVVRNRARRAGVPTVRMDGVLADGLVDGAAEQPEMVAELADERRRLARLVAHLPARYRGAVVLRHVQGLSYAEAAEILGQPVGTTKSNAHRGLRLLRAALEGEVEARERSRSVA